MNKIVIEILQSSVVTQTALDGLSIYLLVAIIKRVPFLWPTVYFVWHELHLHLIYRSKYYRILSSFPFSFIFQLEAAADACRHMTYIAIVNIMMFT